jgi:hypothetical protein
MAAHDLAHSKSKMSVSDSIFKQQQISSRDLRWRRFFRKIRQTFCCSRFQTVNGIGWVLKRATQ